MGGVEYCILRFPIFCFLSLSRAECVIHLAWLPFSSSVFHVRNVNNQIRSLDQWIMNLKCALTGRWLLPSCVASQKYLNSLSIIEWKESEKVSSVHFISNDLHYSCTDWDVHMWHYSCTDWGVHIWLPIYVHGHVVARGWSLVSSSVAFPSYFLRVRIWTGAHCFPRPAGWQVPKTLLSLPPQHWGTGTHSHTTLFYMGPGDPNSSLYASVASTWPDEPFPQPLFLLFYTGSHWMAHQDLNSWFSHLYTFWDQREGHTSMPRSFCLFSKEFCLFPGLNGCSFLRLMLYSWEV